MIEELVFCLLEMINFSFSWEDRFEINFVLLYDFMGYFIFK